MKRVALSWSSGKDSAWSLHLLRQKPDVQVVALITTLNERFDRVAMHAVRRELLEAQADSAGLPLWPVPLPWPCSNEQYEDRMCQVCRRALDEGVQSRRVRRSVLGRYTLDLYRKRPGGQAWKSGTRRGPGRFGSSRKKEAAGAARTNLLAMGFECRFFRKRAAGEAMLVERRAQ